MPRPIIPTRHPDPFPELLPRFAADISAQNEVYRLLRIHLRAMCAAWIEICGESLDELTHDAASHVMMQLPRFGGRSRFGTWAHAVALNVCREKAAKVRRRAKIVTMVPLTGKIVRTYRGSLQPTSFAVEGQKFGGRQYLRNTHCKQGHPVEQRGRKRLCPTCKHARDRRNYYGNNRLG